jgi:hypothetical protein
MGWLELTELGERFVDTMDKLEFELRDARGCVIATRQVAVQDTDGFAGLDFDDDGVADSDVGLERPVDEFEAGLIELGLSEPPVWDDAGEFDSIECLVEPDLPRFQVFVELECADSVPVADRWKDDPDVQQMLHDRRRDRDESSA